MTPSTQPLTVMQHRADAEYAGLLRRFWKPTSRRDECEHCGETYEVPHNGRTGHQRYCSPRCRSTAGTRRYNAAQRERENAA